MQILTVQGDRTHATRWARGRYSQDPGWTKGDDRMHGQVTDKRAAGTGSEDVSRAGGAECTGHFGDAARIQAGSVDHN